MSGDKVAVALAKKLQEVQEVCRAASQEELAALVATDSIAGMFAARELQRRWMESVISEQD